MIGSLNAIEADDRVGFGREFEYGVHPLYYREFEETESYVLDIICSLFVLVVT